jgi:Fe-S cluster biogenesis protein NfuA
MTWIKRLFTKKKEEVEEVFEPSLNTDGTYILAEEFEKMWVDKINHRFSGMCDSTGSLNDRQYIDYKVWEDTHYDAMYKKHFKNTKVFRGKNTNIIFHGGCLGCISQRQHGIDRCMGCSYFRYNNYQSDLSIKGEYADSFNQEDFKEFLKS